VNIGRTRDLEEAGFDLTPMIDVVLLLIIFFMLTAQFTQTMTTEMDLPREKGAQIVEDATHQLVIELTREGGIRIAGEDVSLDKLMLIVAADIKGAKGGAADLDVVVRADRACPASHLNTLAGALTRVGVRDWKLATAGGGGQ